MYLVVCQVYYSLSVSPSPHIIYPASLGLPLFLFSSNLVRSVLFGIRKTGILVHVQTIIVFIERVLHRRDVWIVPNDCIVLYCIVSINLYSASCSAHQSEALPVRETQREESSLERTKRGTWHTS